MFRCCLPCRGGSKAPATSHPNTPVAAEPHHQLPSLVSVYEGNGTTVIVPVAATLPSAGTHHHQQLPGHTSVAPVATQAPIEAANEVRKTILNSSSVARAIGKESSVEEEDEEDEEEESIISVPPTVVQRICQSNQQSPLPHIAEEEEVNVVLLLGNDPKSNNNSSSDRDLVSKLLDHRSYVVPEEFSSPSPPRSKAGEGRASSGQRGKQQSKGRTRSVTSTTSSETITSGNGGGSKSDSVNNNSSSASTNNQQQQPSSGFLVPKMQAEQGSIGDLQKYHSRYLKNRRHTLANVR